MVDRFEFGLRLSISRAWSALRWPSVRMPCGWRLIRVYFNLHLERKTAAGKAWMQATGTPLDTPIKLDQNLNAPYKCGFGHWLQAQGFTAVHSAKQQQLDRAPDEQFNKATKNEVVITLDGGWMLRKVTGKVDQRTRPRVLLKARTDRNGNLLANQWVLVLINLFQNVNLADPSFNGRRLVATQDRSGDWKLAGPTDRLLRKIKKKEERKANHI